MAEGTKRPVVRRSELLPMSLPPIGVSREQAAAFIGVSPSLFDKAVGVSMPNPRMLGGRLIWDVDELVAAFKKLPHKGGEEIDFAPLATSINFWDEA